MQLRQRHKGFLGMVLLVAMLVTGCGRDFDAAGYCQAILNLTFQGDTTEALNYMEEPSEEYLMQQYGAFIEDFVYNNISYELELGENKQTQFAELMSKIFATMRYDVGEAEKVGRRAYDVTINIWPSDVFIRFQQMMTEDSIVMSNSIKEGEYEGTEEEIQAQIMNDIANHAYELLDVAYMDAGYGEKQTVTLHVEAENQDDYAIADEDMNTLVVKILRLDEIQG